jgi:signal transduction histidine kinase
VRSEAAAPTALPPAVARELLRIGQEAVANAVKHARARNVAVEIALGAAEVRLRVVDDGVGFEPGEPPPDGRFGLVGMMERTEALQGRFVIRSRPGQGCEVQAVVPLREAKEGGKEVP